jgi:hypothetical protein
MPASTATTHRAEGEFSIESWHEDPLEDANGGRVYRTTLTKRFRGDLEGTSTGWMTMAQTGAGTGAYGGFERVVATLAGRRGTFLLHHDAYGDAKGKHATIVVLAGSTTDELLGLRGTLVITRHDDGRHTYAFDYELDPAGPP